MIPQMSIRNKLFFSILLILVASYSVLLATTIKSVGKFINEEMNRDLSEHLSYARSQYYSKADIVQHSFIQPAYAPPVREKIKEGNRQWLKDALHRWRLALPFIDIITLVDPDKHVIVRTNSEINGDRLELGSIIDKALVERKPVRSTELLPYSLLVKEGEEHHALASQRHGEAMVITVAVPVFDADGKPLACVVAGDIVNGGTDIINNIKEALGPDHEVVVSQGPFTIASSIKTENPPLDPAITDRLQKGLPYWGTSTINGTTYKTVYEPLLNSTGDWVGSLAISVSESSFDKVRSANERNILLSAILGIGLAFAMAYYTSRNLTEPLKVLAEGVEKIEMGDLAQRVEVASTDEFGRLAESFNRMAAALRERDVTIRRKTDALQDLNELLENKVAERTIELRMEMGRLEAILTSMMEGIIVTDSDNRVILFNPAAQKILDIVPHRVLLQPVEQVFQMGNIHELSEHVSHLRTEQPRLAADADLVVKGKRVKVHISSIHDELDGFAGVVMTLRDVTLEEEVDRMKTEFISTVSHELKTPLTSMKGSLQFIMNKGKWLTDTERELLSICLRNTERLIRLINDILDISKIEAGRVDFIMKPQSIGELVIYSIEEIKSFAMSRNISIVNCIGQDIPLVYGDHDRLVQVITNLLSNSVKFSPVGQVVMLNAAKRGNYVAVSVIDHGKAIRWSDREKLFKKFQQLENSDGGERGGTGLGLAICKEIIERHHGKIYYEQGATGGNVFTFTVPVYEERT